LAKNKTFTQQVLRWYQQYGRKDLPWQQDINPYRVWVSEIMLQQTQVTTVIPYFARFIKRFPDVRCLAEANLDDVLQHWSGLGYYSRARNMHRCAKMICDTYAGEFPDSATALNQLPGIGRSTAGAIITIAFGKPAPILDGNVKRLLARYLAINTWPGNTQTMKQLWEIAESYTPHSDTRAYTQAMMDLGAMVCTRSKPKCHCCPLTKSCLAYRNGLQQQLPIAKPKKFKPTKTTQMLIIMNQQQLLLQKRPPLIIFIYYCLTLRKKGIILETINQPYSIFHQN